MATSVTSATWRVVTADLVDDDDHV